MDMDKRDRAIRDLSDSSSFAGRRIRDVLLQAYDMGHAAGVDLALAARPSGQGRAWVGVDLALAATAADAAASGVGLDFGQALVALRHGRRVARAGWNGKGMWVALTPGTTINVGTPPHGRLTGAALALALSEPERTEIRICDHLDMRAADGSLVVGWLASQTDMLATDWCVLAETRLELDRLAGWNVIASTPPGVPAASAKAVGIGVRLHETLVTVVRRIVDGEFVDDVPPTAPWHLFREATYRSLPGASTPIEVVDLAFSNADGGATVTAGLVDTDLLLSTDQAGLEDIAEYRILAAVAQLDASGRRRDGMSPIGAGAEIAERAGPAPTLTPAQVDEIVAAAEPVTAEIIPPGELAEAMAPVPVEDPLGSAPAAPVGDPTDVQIRDGEGTGEVPVNDPPIADGELPGELVGAAALDEARRSGFAGYRELEKFTSEVGDPPPPAPAGDEITEEGELVLDDDAPPAEGTP